MYNKFEHDKQVGKIGEQIVYNYYRSKGCSVTDVSENNQYQKHDIDFIIDEVPIEVKTQACQLENSICIELTNNIQVDYEGWFFTTKAQYLIFVDRINFILYKIEIDSLRKYYNDNKQRIIHRKNNNIAFIPLTDISDITERIKIK